jgi:predicted DNA-binding transcriptional regulator YafY
MIEQYGYKLPPQELTPRRVAGLHKALQELQDQRDRAITQSHYNQLTQAIQSIHIALYGGTK